MRGVGAIIWRIKIAGYLAGRIKCNEYKGGDDIASQNHIAQPPRSGVIAVDLDRCLACRECEVACSLYHEGVCAPSLSRIRVDFDDFTPGPPTISVCKQCDWPACLFACAALWDDPAIIVDPVSGARVIDPDRCRGCGACVRACPLTPERAVIALRPRDATSRRKVAIKCDLCYARPEGPICVEVCPGGALTLVPAGGAKGGHDGK
jgi:anaerobic carbon-monoxide dehydrogenase iron sulfur subunit